jgi:hypothetical protein
VEPLIQDTDFLDTYQIKGESDNSAVKLLAWPGFQQLIGPQQHILSSVTARRRPGLMLICLQILVLKECLLPDKHG